MNLEESVIEGETRYSREMATGSAEAVVCTEVRGRTLVIAINRPDAMNALNAEVAEALLSAVDQLDREDELSVGVLTGSGRCFSAGMDLKAFASGADVGRLMDFYRRGSAKPLVAAVEGFVLAGGFELALTCDLIVAARGSSLGLPEVRVGLFAAGGGLYRLPHAVPVGASMEMALTGEPITAEEGYTYGLVTRLADKGEALTVALELADRIGRGAPLALCATKELIRGATGLTERAFWSSQSRPLKAVFESEDAREGADAFLESGPRCGVARRPDPSCVRLRVLAPGS